jgi:hypothetical protein
MARAQCGHLNGNGKDVCIAEATRSGTAKDNCVKAAKSR